MKKNKKSLTKSFIGAISLNSYVKVKLNNENKICQIISIRPNDLNKNENEESLNEYSYEYYIHYIEYDKRNDHWIKRKDIIETKISNEEIKKIKNAKDEIIFKNKGNEGYEKYIISAHEENIKVRTIDEILFGKYRCSTWYFSPFPEEYHNKKILFFCEFCLNFYITKEELERHIEFNCFLKHPPGNEIYRDNLISIFEVDGNKETIYCENLSYLAKLFLEHKNLAWKIEGYLFYILTEYDKYGFHLIGFFSKEKEKEKEEKEDWNLSSILILPFHQRKGYGKFLIDFSYLLSKRENKYGTPERPLSDLGYKAYFSYWTQKICETIIKWKGDYITMNNISEETQINLKDMHNVMKELHLLRYYEGNYIIVGDKKILKEIIKKTGRYKYPLYPEKLIWTPYIKDKIS